MHRYSRPCSAACPRSLYQGCSQKHQGGAQCPTRRGCTVAGSVVGVCAARLLGKQRALAARQAELEEERDRGPVKRVLMDRKVHLPLVIERELLDLWERPDLATPRKRTGERGHRQTAHYTLTLATDI
jgi:hypothetical protein